MFELFGQEGPEVDDVTDYQVPVADGTIMVRVYRPVAGRLPAHVVLHGGGWTTGSVLELVADASARQRAVGARCVVVGVEYRLAPEHPFPTAVHDVVAAVRWVREHADALGIDPGVISLGGASAGANLAAAAATTDPGLDLAALLLEVPALDLRANAELTPIDLGPAFAEILAGLPEVFAATLREYFADVADAESPMASPLLAPDLTVFPETHLLLAELDPLRGQGEQFAAMLEAAGVSTSVHIYPGALHGSGILTKSWPTAAQWQQDAIDMLADLHARRLPAMSAELPARA